MNQRSWLIVEPQGSERVAHPFQYVADTLCHLLCHGAFQGCLDAALVAAERKAEKENFSTQHLNTRLRLSCQQEDREVAGGKLYKVGQGGIFEAGYKLQI